MVAYVVPNGEQTFLDMNGDPLSGGFVHFYAVDTNELADTWQNFDQFVKNTNPITLDQAGRAIIWGVGKYRQVVTDQFGTVQWDRNTEAGIDFSNVTGPVVINGTMTVNGASTFNGDTTTNGNAHINGTLGVSGDTTLAGLSAVAPKFTVGGSWDGNPTFQQGMTLLNGACVNGMLTNGIPSCLIRVDNNNDLQLGVGVSGQVQVLADGGLVVTTGGLVVDGPFAATFDSVTVLRGQVIDGNLAVGGSTVLQDLTVQGNETVSGNLTVNGAINLHDAVINNLTVNGTETVSGAAHLLSTLAVDGNTTIGGDLAVTGVITSSGGGSGATRFPVVVNSQFEMVAGTSGAPAPPPSSPVSTHVSIGTDTYYFFWEPFDPTMGVGSGAYNSFSASFDLPNNPGIGFTIEYRIGNPGATGGHFVLTAFFIPSSGTIDGVPILTITDAWDTGPISNNAAFGTSGKLVNIGSNVWRRLI